jgi:hypothetical protein
VLGAEFVSTVEEERNRVPFDAEQEQTIRDWLTNKLD